MPHLQGTFAHPADLQTMSMQEPQDVASRKKAVTRDDSCTMHEKIAHCMQWHGWEENNIDYRAAPSSKQMHEKMCKVHWKALP